MSRYIKTDALMEDIGSLYRDEDHTDYNIAIADALDVIDEQPTADVVEVVRCKDCKYCEHWYADKGRCFLWHESGIDVFEDGFCNYGERREDAEAVNTKN